MKTAIVVYRDAADEPQDALDGRTLLQAARSRTATRLAQQGCGGWMPAETATEVAARPHRLARACGMNRELAEGLRRGPLEAWLLAEPPAPGDWVYHIDLITEDGGVIRSVPRIPDQETRELTLALNQAVGPGRGRFAAVGPGVLNLALPGAGDELPEGLPTDQVLDRDWLDVLPEGRERMRLLEIMEQARDTLSRHPVNEIRVDLGEDPANGIWLCGGGRWPDGARRPDVVRPVVLLSGSLTGRALARLLDAPILPLRGPGPGGDEAWFHLPDLVAAMRERDALVVDIPVPRTDDAVDGVREVDRIDQHLLGPLVEILAAARPYRVALVGGAAVSPETGLPVCPRLPVMIAGDDLPPDATLRWDEAACTAGGLGRIEFEGLVSMLDAAPDVASAPFALGQNNASNRTEAP